MNIDQKAAEACGVRIVETMAAWYLPHQSIANRWEWTLNDARCREIVRWRFGISTEICFDSITGLLRGVRCLVKSDNPSVMHSSIDEAEIACIKAILEAQDETSS